MKKTVFLNREFYLSRTKHIPDRYLQSIIILSRWLLLKTLVISTWFGVWLVNCIWFSWIIVGFFILTKLFAYTFSLEDASPGLIFVVQKHPNFYQFLPGKIAVFFGRYVCSPGVTRRYRQNWNVCIIIVIIIIIIIIIIVVVII